MVGGILAGNTDILAFAKERSDVLLPVWVIERIAEPAAGGRRIIINKRIVDLPQNRNAFTFFYFVEIDGQVMRIGIGIAFLLVIKLPDRVGKVVIAYIRKRENGVGVIFLYSYGLPAHLFLHRLGADFLGDGVGIIFCPVSLYLFRKVGQTDFGIVILTLIGAVHGNELNGVVGDMTAHGIINVAVGAACTLGFYFGKGILVGFLQNIRYGIAKLDYIGCNFQIIIDRSAGLC